MIKIYFSRIKHIPGIGLKAAVPTRSYDENFPFSLPRFKMEN